MGSFLVSLSLVSHWHQPTGELACLPSFQFSQTIYTELAWFLPFNACWYSLVNSYRSNIFFMEKLLTTNSIYLINWGLLHIIYFFLTELWSFVSSKEFSISSLVSSIWHKVFHDIPLLSFQRGVYGDRTCLISDLGNLYPFSLSNQSDQKFTNLLISLKRNSIWPYWLFSSSQFSVTLASTVILQFLFLYFTCFDLLTPSLSCWDMWFRFFFFLFSHKYLVFHKSS